MQPAITVGLALGLAYLLGDFPFQSFRLTNSRSQGWTKIVGHGLIHWLIVLLLVVVFASHYVVLSWRFAIMASCYVIFHLALDAGRGHLIRHKCVADSTTTFLMDQGLHCAVVFGFTLGVTKIDWQAVRELGTISENTRNLGLAGAIVYGSVVFAGGYLIRYMTKGLVASEQLAGEESVEQLEAAGLYIGWLERFLIVTAVVLRSPALIGLILTGKSIARFPEMKEPKFAEYFLIGTLLSFTLALLGGLLLLRIWEGTLSLQP